MLDSRRNIALACALSALAGYVDAVGFLYLGGLFVSFMSGNSTRLGVSLAEGHWSNAAEAIGLIALFVTGAAAGSLIVLRRGAIASPGCCWQRRRCWPSRRSAYTLGQPKLAIARSCWRWDWKMRCSRSRAVPGSASPTSRARWSRWANLPPWRYGRAALGLGPEFAAVRGAGDGGGVRHAGLSLDQSRRDLVCRRRGAGAERDRFCDEAFSAFLTQPGGR